MTAAFRISLLAIGLASLVSVGGAWAGSLVEFANISEQGPATLVGYLARPDQGLSALLGGAGHSVERFPAVVVLHECGGISSHSAGIADRLGSEGYVALAVDSLGPRGVASRCDSIGSPEQAFDAYSARRYLAQQGFVDARGSPSSANRWAAMRYFTPSIAVWRRNISPSGFRPRSPITRPAFFRW